MSETSFQVVDFDMNQPTRHPWGVMEVEAAGESFQITDAEPGA